MKKIICVAIVSVLAISACVEKADGQTHPLLRIGCTAGVVEFSHIGMLGGAVGPFNLGGTVELRAADLGSEGAIYVGIDYRYADGGNFFGNEWCDVWHHTAALRGTYVLGDPSRRVNFYAGGSIGLKAELVHWYKKKDDNLTDYRADGYHYYGRAFVGMHVRILRWLGLVVEAGLPTNQLNLGLAFDF